MKMGSWLPIFQYSILKVFYPKRDQKATDFGSQDKYSRIKLHHLSLEGKGLRLSDLLPAVHLNSSRKCDIF